MNTNKSAFIIAHFHPQGYCPINLVNLVKYLSSISAEIIFVSTNLQESYANNLRQYAHVIVRQNFGYDFWSYKIGLENLKKKSSLDRISFLNSSFITLDPKILCDHIITDVTTAAMKGIVRSTEISPHIPSYWVSFEGNDLINSKEFEQWWSNMIPISDKLEVVHTYEIGMSTYFASLGVPLIGTLDLNYGNLFLAICRGISNGRLIINEPKEILNLDSSIGKSINIAHYLWDVLYHQLKIFKVDFFKHNPLNLDFFEIFQNLKNDNFQYQYLIEDAVFQK
jgi:lipopolysaccharide biosynthesis protein